MSKLSLDRDKIDQCKRAAEQIVSPVYHYIERQTTTSIERSVLRMMGIEGALPGHSKKPPPQGDFPLVNVVVDKIGHDRLSRGAAYWFGLAALHHPQLEINALAEKIARGDIKLDQLSDRPMREIDRVCQEMIRPTLERLRKNREKNSQRHHWRHGKQPLRYVIVATGNIHEDVAQAQAAAEMGADIIAVIRSTAQSLLDYVPEGETTEGYGGTFATQINFRLMRQALDESEKKLKRRIGLTNYSSGLCMSEIAVMGALEGVDFLLNDAMYGILFRDINMKRNFIDQNFSRRICALSGITIQTGEDNYLTTAESFKSWYQVLASHFINQAFAKRAGFNDQHLALGHAFEMDPWIEDSLLYEWAQAQLVREIFPRSPIKFMPPTKHKTGDIFFSYLYDGLFNLTGVLTGQTIQLLGMHTEAIHNPYIQDRYLSLKNANYVFNAAKSLSDDIMFQSHGKIARRSRQVLDDALQLLRKVRFRGMLRAIEGGAFANVRRGQDEGKGLEGVIGKDRDYYTPLQRYLTPKALRDKEEGRGYRRRRGGERRSPAPSRRQRQSGSRNAPSSGRRGGGSGRSSSQQNSRSRSRRRPLQNKNNQQRQGRSSGNQSHPRDGVEREEAKNRTPSRRTPEAPAREPRVTDLPKEPRPETSAPVAAVQEPKDSSPKRESVPTPLPRRPLPRRKLKTSSAKEEENSAPHGSKDQPQTSQVSPQGSEGAPSRLPRRQLKTENPSQEEKADSKPVSETRQTKSSGEDLN